MSMMARFVAVGPNRLDEIRNSPDLVEELFAPEAGILPLELSATLQERVRRQAPQVLESVLGRMQPAMREQLMRRLGIGEGDLGTAAIGDAILRRMGERAASPRQRARGAGGPAVEGISLDKAWHGLHYLLCGALEPAPGPLGQAVFGGTEIGEDQGYGPARYFSPAQVAEIAAALQSPGLERELHGRFDAAAMTQMGIYPGVWEADDYDWLIDAFRTLRDFYAAASKAGQSVVTAIE